MELLIVEGQSALHAIDQVRRAETQAVLCMQGKLPNAVDRPRSRVLAHAQCQMLFSTLGCGVEPDCDPENLRYRQVCLLVEGDADGQHVLWLQLLLFKQYLAPLLEHRFVRVIHAPVGRLPAPDTNLEKPACENYLWNEAEKRRYLDSANDPGQSTITAFKGIASLSSSEIDYLLVDPTTRRERIVTL